MDCQTTLNRIMENNSRISQVVVKKILIVYDEKMFYLGDTCINFDRFRVCKSFFGDQAVVAVNCINAKRLDVYKGFAKHNPTIDHTFSTDYEHIDAENYDVIIVIAYDEWPLLKVLHEQYTCSGNIAALHTAVFSFSRLLLFARGEFRILFPVYDDLLAHALRCLDQPGEIWLTENERQWGNQWLESKGLGQQEKLVVMLDSSADRSKLLRLDVYADIVLSILKQDNTRILVFDEKGIGKAGFYRGVVGACGRIENDFL